jgi:Xaa-Pro aminopeptidase
MVPRSEYEERQQRTRHRAAALGLSALVCVSGPFYERPGDVAYLCGHFPPFPTSEGDGEVAGTGHAVLVLDRERTVLLVDTPCYREDLVVASEVRVARDLWREAARLLERASGPLGCVGWDRLPAEGLEALRAAAPGLVRADDVVRALRRRKSPLEVELLRAACACAREALLASAASCLAGVSEREVSARGVAAGFLAGADFVRYLRVHSGPWSAWPTRWPPATDRLLEKGDLVLLDAVGARSGYAFDVGRTSLVGFDALPWQRRLLEATQKALGRALEAIRPGKRAGDVAAAVLAAYEAAGLREHASPFVGHGIGIETVEAPLLREGSQQVLQEGAVLCVEPGVYVPGRGGACVEEVVVVVEGGCEVLSATVPRRLWE